MNSLSGSLSEPYGQVSPSFEFDVELEVLLIAHVMESGKSHFWVETIHDGAFLVTLFEVSRRLPLFWPFILLAIPRGFKRKFDLFLKFSKEQVRKRVARQGAITRTDFFANLLSEKATNVSEDWLIAQANVLVIAGSDTTATALATIVYFLTKHPQQLGRLQDEIRSTFVDAESMTDSKLQSLPYLAAVIEEGLRMFPPTSFGLPRISPGTRVDNFFVPAGVSMTFFSTHTIPTFTCTLYPHHQRSVS